MPPANPWKFGEFERRLPLYFASVSSVKSNLPLVDYVRVLNLVAGDQQYLVSAYDIMRGDLQGREALAHELTVKRSAGTLVLMDSGNYESFWKGPVSPWRPEEFYEALRIGKPSV